MKISEIVAESKLYRFGHVPKAGKMVPSTDAQQVHVKVGSSSQYVHNPKRLGSVMAIKKAKARRGSTMKIKRSFTKRTSFQIRVSRLNRAARSAELGTLLDREKEGALEDNEI